MNALELLDRGIRPSWVWKIDVTTSDSTSVVGPCWIWHGAKDPSGYGCVSINARATRIHRAMYELLVGPIPDGMHIDHLCRQPSCCNPEHLEPVTPRENSRRGIRGVLTTHCPRGHEYIGENLIVTSENRRVCKQCRDEYMPRYRENRRRLRAATWAKYLGADK